MTEFRLPQSDPDIRKWPKRFVELERDSVLVEYDYIKEQDIDHTAFYGARAKSTSVFRPARGVVKDITLNEDDDRYAPGMPVEGTSEDDFSVFWQGVIFRTSATPAPRTVSVAIIHVSPTAAEVGNWDLQIKPVSGVSLNPTASMGMSDDTLDASDLALGDIVTINTQTDKDVNPSDVLLFYSLFDVLQYVRLVVRTHDPDTGSLEAMVLKTTITDENSAWIWGVVGTSAVGADELATSTTSITIGSGSHYFEIQAGKFFPVDATVILTPTDDTTAKMLATVAAYNGTDLYIRVPANGVTGSGTFDAWTIALLDGPVVIPFYQLNGLVVSDAGSNNIYISGGSVRDSTDTLNLILEPGTLSGLLKKKLDTAFAFGDNQGSMMQSANLAGTVSSSGNSVTGTGTNFQGDTGDFFLNVAFVQAHLLDYANQWSNTIGYTPNTWESIIAVGGTVRRVTAVASDTALTTDGSLGASGSTYKRGGWLADADGVHYAIVLVRKDSTGECDVISCAFNGSGVPDLPAGYTYYRVLAGAIVGHPSLITYKQIFQPLRNIPSTDSIYHDFENDVGILEPWAILLGNTAGEAISLLSWYLAATIASLPKYGCITITPTAVSGSISSVDTATEIITWSTTHGLTTGEIIVPLAGTWPTGTSLGMAYYVNALTTTTFALYLTYADAIANTNKVNLTAAGSGTRTMRRMVLATKKISGLDSTTPFQFNTATTDITPTAKLDFTLSDANAIKANAFLDVRPTGTSSVLSTPTSATTTSVTMKRMYSDSGAELTWAGLATATASQLQFTLYGDAA